MASAPLLYQIRHLVLEARREGFAAEAILAAVEKALKEADAEAAGTARREL